MEQPDNNIDSDMEFEDNVPLLQLPMNNLENILQAINQLVRPIESEEDKISREICSHHMIDYIKLVRANCLHEYKEDAMDFEYTSITRRLAKIVKVWWFEKEELPYDANKFMDFVQYCCDYQYRNRPCVCLLDNWNDEEKKKDIYEITKKYILFYADLPGCDYMSNMQAYKLLNKHLPSTQELQEYVARQNEFENDPEQYHQDHKHQLPTANLALLKPIVYDDEEPQTCGICYNEIKPGMTVLQLPCGGKHIFHTDENDCLEGLTITQWLQSNKVCPMCKDEIIINLNDP